MNRKLAAFLILFGFFLPCISFPFAKPKSAFDGLYGVKAPLTRYEIVLKKGDFTPGKGNSVATRYALGTYEGRIVIPYRYVIAAGVLSIFLGIGIIVFSKIGS